MSPLANQSQLTQLNDIIAPNTASFWPIALIYWLLLIVFIAFILLCVYIFKRNQKRRLKQKKALHQLQCLQKDNANFVAVNQLLKGVALSYFPRQQVASLHSQQWFDFLQRYSTTPIFDDKETFFTRLYQDCQSCFSATESDFSQAKKWVKQLPKQIKKHQKEANKHV